MDISFVIPCYRSEKTVSGVISELEQVMTGRPALTYEVVCVVDGSPDNVADVLVGIARRDDRVRVLELARNYGRASAVMAGYHVATGSAVVVLDDDGQCPVDRLWDLLEPLDRGFDVVSARFASPTKTPFRRLGSSLNGWMERRVIGLPEGFKITSFTAISSFVRDQLAAYRSPFPYYSGYISRITTRFTTVEMQERPRAAGESGFTFGKMLKLWVNGFVGMSVRPLRLAYFLSGAFFVLSLLAFVLSAGLALGGLSVGAAIVSGVLLLSTAAVLLMLGLMGEYLGRTLLTLNGAPQYVVRRRTGFPGEE